MGADEKLVHEALDEMIDALARSTKITKRVLGIDPLALRTQNRGGWFLTWRVRYLREMARTWLKVQKKIEINDHAYSKYLEVCCHESDEVMGHVMVQSAMFWSDISVNYSGNEKVPAEFDILCAVFLIKTADAFLNAIPELNSATVTQAEMRVQLERVSFIEACFQGMTMKFVKKETISGEQGRRRSASKKTVNAETMECVKARLKADKAKYIWTTKARTGELKVNALARDIREDLRGKGINRSGYSIRQRLLPYVLRQSEQLLLRDFGVSYPQRGNRK